MIRVVPFPVKKLSRLADFLAEQEQEGFIPLTGVFVPTSDSPGVIVYTLYANDESENEGFDLGIDEPEKDEPEVLGSPEILENETQPDTESANP